MIYVTDGTAIFGNTAVNHGAIILSEARPPGSEQVTLLIECLVAAVLNGSMTVMASRKQLYGGSK